MHHIVEEKIKESIERGEFDHLPGKGEPLHLKEELQGLSPEIRRAYKILKTAGYIPEDKQKDKLTFHDLYNMATGKVKDHHPYDQEQWHSFVNEREWKRKPTLQKYVKQIYRKLFY